jgi:Arc/MetJ-type ribon-helix-helix transcriptional regulator
MALISILSQGYNGENILRRETMLIQTKLQIDKESYDFIKKVHKKLNYRSLSEYIRAAVNAKIREDRRQIRAMTRAAAMEMLGEASPDNLFESIEGDDFEGR